MSMEERGTTREQPLVLIVDDDGAMRLLERASLEQVGFAVEEAENGVEALSAFERLRPDVVLLDVMMPEMDGFCACGEIRKLPDANLTPILMVTGLDDMDSISRAYEVGATDFITKPINWAVLGHHVRYMVRASQAALNLRRSEEALRASEERYALAARGANDGLWDWDIRSRKVYYSPRWRTMLGYGEHEIGSGIEEWLSRVHPDDAGQVKLQLSAHMEGVLDHFESEHRVLHNDRTYRWVLVRGIAMRDQDGKAYRMAGSQTDVTMRKRAEEQLVRDALYDGLTGLPNRTLVTDRLDQALRHIKRNPQTMFAVLFLDLDRFKVINDSLSHKAGDQLLIEMARRLEASLRPGDTVARLGGDEFVILLEDVRSVDDAERIAERLQRKVMAPLKMDSREVFPSASIGIALSSVAYERPEELLRDADTAMYKAKATGKARHMIFDQSMHTHAVTLLELENDLRRAIERDEFCIHYQPVVSLDDGKIQSVEALLRWQHPERGLVYPGEFIALAEETGLIVPIGEWVLRTACNQIKTWDEAGFPPIRVAVNVSARQLRQRDFVEMVAEILTETGIASKRLELEITESMLMEDPEATTALLERVKALGVHLSLDDFGTGYSSLSYLQHFPVDKVKIDRSFINKMVSDNEKFEIVHTMVTLARKMAMDVVAEGVETEEQVSRLQEMKCHHGQGYIFSRPVDKCAIEALLTSMEKYSLGTITRDQRFALSIQK